jgi:hypothetical protein
MKRQSEDRQISRLRVQYRQLMEGTLTERAERAEINLDSRLADAARRAQGKRPPQDYRTLMKSLGL